jgi:hypothetical protein
MLEKIFEIKEKVVESSIAIGEQVTELVITKSTEMIEKYGPAVLEKVEIVSAFYHSKMGQDQNEEAPEVDVSVSEEPVIVEPEPTFAEKLETIKYSELKKKFTKNQILKIVYIMEKSPLEWYSPREISEASEVLEFKVLPGNVRKALQYKGLKLGYITHRHRAGGRKNAKEYKVTDKGIEFITEQLF